MSNKNRALLFDVIYLSIVGIIGEFINHMALGRFSAGYYFSITLIIGFIAIFRSGYMGILPAIITAFTYVLLNDGATIGTLTVFVIGNLGIITSALFLDKVGRDSIRYNRYLALVYVLIGYVSVIVIRGLLTYVLDPEINLVSALFLMLTNEFLSMLAVMMLFSLLSKRKSLLVDLRTLYSEHETIESY